MGGQMVAGRGGQRVKVVGRRWSGGWWGERWGSPQQGGEVLGVPGR